MSLCARASAQEAPAFGARAKVFISPAGEPFRSSAPDVKPTDLWFQRADADHDGALSEAEFVADAVSFFRKLDANHDGVIDGFEISDYEQKIAPEILPRIATLTARDIPPLPDERLGGQRDTQRFPAEGSRRGRAGPSGAVALGLIKEPEPVSASDTDFDGKVTLAEFTAAARRHFATLDVHHTGRIQRADLPSTPAEQIAAKAERKRKPPSR